MRATAAGAPTSRCHNRFAVSSSQPRTCLRVVPVSLSKATVAMVASVQRPPWDPEKARTNFDKHGVTFEEARVALNHPLARQWPDPEHSDDEERSIVIGLSPGGRLLLIVTATGANGKMRIISARRATKRERHAYEDV